MGWAADSARRAGVAVPAALEDAIAALAQSLRAIRHADGGLPQFHGSGRGVPGRLDRCLAASPGPAITARGKPLGYARMARGRTTLILDAATPPMGEAAGMAHASTLGFELVCGRQPIILSCGTGDHIGPVWAEAARRSHNHSALTLAGMNSSRFVADMAGPDLLADSAARVWAGDFDDDGHMTAPDCGPAHSANPAHILSGHDGWLASHGLTCLRELWLEPDGLTLDGEDSLVALDPPAQEVLDQRLAERGAAGIGLDIRFHLHPAIRASIEGEAMRLILPEGEDWFFSHDGNARMRLEPSRWLDPDRRQPVASQQIVLTALLTARAVQVGWTFARAEVR
ncbi:heparinase II/III-family protein [Paracoccus sp. DMF-8]|uniref:heparinase II/III-family protein n=1 Tax=Paracoccus sp. DMF-8 TaxID=3019445 RepID=UPI0023E890A1|nr:heparinase II/III-family protein [Paracoccus sp. DMF-8]MDF3604942.1 heparinase II/III-family protein [Paracoccus sp. DMF-8]